MERKNEIVNKSILNSLMFFRIKILRFLLNLIIFFTQQNFGPQDIEGLSHYIVT